LTKALQLSPKDGAILEEVKSLTQLQEKSKSKQSSFASSAFGGKKTAGIEQEEKISRAKEQEEEKLFSEYISKFGLPNDLNIEMVSNLDFSC
jgi:hypothetical protein